MQFHFIVVSIFLKKCVKDLVIALVKVFVNILVYFNKLANNFLTTRQMFKKN